MWRVLIKVVFELGVWVIIDTAVGQGITNWQAPELHSASEAVQENKKGKEAGIGRTSLSWVQTYR